MNTLFVLLLKISLTDTFSSHLLTTSFFIHSLFIFGVAQLLITLFFYFINYTIQKDYFYDYNTFI